MAKIKLNGDTSGYIEISAPAVSGNNTLELGPGTKILTNLDNTFTGVSTFTNGLHVTGGSFGLGTDNPASKLEVKAASAPHITSVHSTTDHITMTTGTTGSGLHITSGNHFSINHQPFADRAGDTNLTERFRIATDGIATFNAENININRNAGDPYIALQTSGTSNATLYGGASTGFRVFTKPSGGSLAERLRVANDGTVSIGSPSSGGWKLKVVVDDNASYQSAVNISNNVNADFTFDIKSNEVRVGPSVAIPLLIKTGNTEKVRIQSGGNVLLGNTTSTSTASPVNLSLGGTFSNSHGQNPKLNLWEDSVGDYMSLGVSSSQMDFTMSRDEYDFVWYGQNDSDNGPEERMRLDNGEKLLDFTSTCKIRLKGSSSIGRTHAHLNIGSDGSTNTDTRAIDIWGSWGDQESKSITWNHGTTTSQMVCQQRVRYNTTPSTTVYEIGRFYNGQDTTAFPFQLQSTSTTTADLTVDGQIYNKNQSFVAYSTQSNNIQSSTKIDYTVSTSYQSVFSNSNSRFTAQRAGLYLFYVRHWFIANQTGTVYLDMMKNGTSVKEFRVTHPTASSEYETIQGSALVYMAVNDYMEVNGSASGNAYLHESAGNRHSEFSGFYVSG